jgi:hypothetical protein
VILRQPLIALFALTVTAVLNGCGGGGSNEAVVAPPQATRVDMLSSSQQGMQSIASSGGSAFVSLANTSAAGSAVLKTALPVQAASTWSPVPLGRCALGPHDETIPQRAPSLKQLGDTLWLFQPWFEGPSNHADEHALCEMSAQGTGFTPRDEALYACNPYYCTMLWMSDLKLVGNRLFSNAGAGLNLFVSDDKAASWRVLLGEFDSMICTHQAFHIVGDRLLVGGECPLDVAFIRAYQLTADGSRLASKEPLPVTLPVLENRNVQFIESAPGTNRVFAGIEGGLLRSDDGARSFKPVIHHSVDDVKSYPYIRAFLAPSKNPGVIVVGGFDKASAKPYLAWSADNGDHWTDLSSMLPGFNRNTGDFGKGGQVTALMEDPQGRLLLTVNEEPDAKGHLMLLTLGKP